jgi:Domain of unknown function (DUF4139)/N-terminal domain of unknown function (DUF4140)
MTPFPTAASFCRSSEYRRFQRQRAWTIMAAVVMCATSSLIANPIEANPLESTGKLDAVTVYRGQAQVTRLVKLPDQAGIAELVVTGLPPSIQPSSLFAEMVGARDVGARDVGARDVGAGDVGAGEVRNVRYRARAVEDDVREGVKQFDDQLATLNDQIREQEVKAQVLAGQATYLDKLEQFTAPTANIELTRGVLNAETLNTLTQFQFTQRARIAAELLAVDKTQRDLRAQRDLLSRKRAELTQGASRVAREAVVLVDVKQPGQTLRLKYLVDGANWQPSYAVNATSDAPQVMVQYQAQITQMTGEDWGDVAMTLSTAMPNVVARLPELEPMDLSLVKADQVTVTIDRDQFAMLQAQQRDKLSRVIQQPESNLTEPIASRQAGQVAARNESAQQQARNNFAATMPSDNNVNRLANDMQEIELRSGQKPNASRESGATSPARAQTSITVSYKLPNRTTLPSRNDQQIVGISSMAMPARFYKTATPLLSEFVYTQADVTNSTTNVLLAGPSTSYLNGEFVGLGELPTTGIGGEFVIGFGADPSMAVTREIVDRSEQIQGGNKINLIDYRLSVINLSDKPQQVRLLDRMPKPEGAQLKVAMAKTSHPVSDDPLFASQAKSGLLRFDVEAPAKANLDKALHVDYQLQIEHDRNLQLALPVNKK